MTVAAMALPAQRVSPLQVEREHRQDRVTVDDLAGRGHREAAIGVAVVGDPDIGAASDAPRPARPRDASHRTPR